MCVLKMFLLIVAIDGCCVASSRCVEMSSRVDWAESQMMGSVGTTGMDWLLMVAKNTVSAGTIKG